MATVVNFHGKKCIEPGSYAAIMYNPTSVVNVSEFGNVMIIDTGLSLATVNGTNSEFAGGSGINGALNKGLKSVYTFESYEDFVQFMGGGFVADIAQKIFTPRDGVAGAPKLFYTRAATTTPAKITLVISEGNTLELTCKNEGLCGNGIADSNSILKKGYAAKLVEGSTDGTYVLQILMGTFMGYDEYGEPFGSYSFEDATPEIITQSPDCKTLTELYNWVINDKVCLAHFKAKQTGAASLTATISQTLASGGTTSFDSTSDYSKVLECISEMDISFFLCTNLNADNNAGTSTLNGMLFTHIKQNAKFDEIMVVPGGEGDDDIFGDANCSQSIAKYYDDEKVWTVHGAPIVSRKDGNGDKQLKAIYNAAMVVGLNAGMAPQTPLTFKRSGYQSYAYDLTKKERENALQAGIIHMRNVGGYYCINQGVTTIQNNKQTYTPDGQSMECSIALIKAQLNKELILEGQMRFTGLTAAQADPESVKTFTDTKLSSFIATALNDNLILGYKNIKVSVKNSNYTITYDFIPNVPVNKTFFVGNVLDFTL